MRVNMRFAYPGLFEKIPNGTYDVPENSTIQECAEKCALDNGTSLVEGWPEKVLFLKNNKPAEKDETATENSDIIIIHRILGG